MQELDSLIQGFFNFKDQIINEKDKQSIVKLSKQQNPDTLVISCSDSRVDPAILLNTDLGEIFVVRNVANIIPPFQADRSTYHGTSASLEFAIKILKVKNIVIIGHSNCGGIKALIDNDITQESPFEHILDWVFILKEAKEKTKHIQPKNNMYHECEKMGIGISIQNLKTFPFVKEKLDDHTLKIYGFYFSISDMSLELYNEETQDFKVLSSI